MQLMQLLIKRVQALEDAYHEQVELTSELARRLERADARSQGSWRELAEQDGRLSGRIESMEDRLSAAERSAQTAEQRLRDESARIQTLFGRLESIDHRSSFVSEHERRLDAVVQRVIELENRTDQPAFRSTRLLERLQAIESRVANVETLAKETAPPPGRPRSAAELDARIAQLGFQAKVLEEKFAMLDSLRSVLGDPDLRQVIDDLEVRLSRMDAQISTLFTLQRVNGNDPGAVVKLGD